MPVYKPQCIFTYTLFLYFLCMQEDYLDDAAFQATFGVTRAAFAAMPKWKRDDQKKKKGIF